jgi:hypothetical protein
MHLCDSDRHPINKSQLLTRLEMAELVLKRLYSQDHSQNIVQTKDAKTCL